MIFIDSNVLIDLSQPTDRWHRWSVDMLGALAHGATLVINPIVLAEFSVRYESISSALTFLGHLEIEVRPIGDEAAFRAGQAHKAYRRAGGERLGILADFLIGADAAELGATLLTRDRQRFASYFPELTLITPETHPNG